MALFSQNENQYEDVRDGGHLTFVIGWYPRERSSRHWHRCQAEQRPKAFQMLPRDKCGAKVGEIVLTFCVLKSLSAFRHFRNSMCFIFQSPREKTTERPTWLYLCELQLARRGQALPESVGRTRFRRSQIRLRGVDPRHNSTLEAPLCEPET